MAEKDLSVAMDYSYLMSRLSDLGEKKVVDMLLSQIGPSRGIGLGDDAAAVLLGERYLVASTDLIAQRTHMPPCMTAYQKGWMVAAVNLSDIAAMGAMPIGLLVAYGLPRETEMQEVADIARGVRDCCEECNAEYLGGDTKESAEMVLVGTSLGIVRKDGILQRRGARPGDLLAVTGTIGLASTGFLEIDLKDHEKEARKAALMPRPKTKEGTILSASGCVTSCMDTSDGLAMSVHELGKASGVGFDIDLTKLPYDELARKVVKRFGLDLREVCLYGGGDYQLLFTLDPVHLDRLKRMLGDYLTVIGEAKEGMDMTMWDGQGREPLPRRGYEHFKE